MDSKLYNIEFGTFTVKSNKAFLSIPKQLFTVESLKDLENAIPDINSPPFLRIEEIEEVHTSYQFTYQLDTTYLRNLKEIRKEHITIRFSIAQAILEQDILNSFNGYVSSYPANIWYHPMHSIKYAYRGTYEMASTENESKIVRYKALALYILFGYPYEKALKKEYFINEKNNPFAIQIINAESIEQLTGLIRHEYDRISFEDITRRNGRNPLLRLGVVVVVPVLVVSMAVAVTMANHNKKELQAADDKYQQQLEANLEEMQQGYEKEIGTLQLEMEEKDIFYKDELNQLKIEAALKEDDLEKSVQLLEEAGVDNKGIFNHLYENNAYNLALSYYPEGLEKIIQKFHKNDEADQVLMLELSEDVAQDISGKLNFEKEIVSFAQTTLDYKWVFSDDKYILVRTAEAYIKNGFTGVAGNIRDKLSQLEHEVEAEYLTALLYKLEVESKLQGANESLEQASQLPEDDTNRANRITEAETNIQKYSEDLSAAENRLEDTKTKVNETWGEVWGQV